MLESQLVAKILKAYRERGAYAEKIHGSAMQPRVIDIFACYRGRFIGLEAKVGNNRPTIIQHEIIDRITQAGGVSYVVWDVRAATVVLDSIDEELDG